MKEFFKNRFELTYGLAYGLLSCLKFGWTGIIIAVGVSILWRLGGMYGHKIRVYGCPLWVLTPITLHSTIGYIISALIISPGYSIPDVNQPKASPLGTFFYKLFDQNRLYADIATRGAIYLLLILAYVFTRL